jgi:hypothetical protein
VLLKRIAVVSYRGTVPITGTQYDVFVRDVIDMHADLTFVALSIAKLAVLDRFADCAS